jgi:signal transduction histidine kinase
MALAAVLFLLFTLLIIARIPWKYQAVWLGLVLLFFSGCLIGLINLISRFGNSQLEGQLLNLLPLNEPAWIWQLLSGFTLYEFMRFRLWCVVGFAVAAVGFLISYTSDRPLRKSDWVLMGLTVLAAGFLLWNYDPEHLFQLYRLGLAKPPGDRFRWELQLHWTDSLALGLILLLFCYIIFRLIWLFFRVTIPQKRAQILFVAVVQLILCGFFLILFCMGRGSIFNTHAMATTLLPLTDYPEFDTTYLEVAPFAALGAIGLVGWASVRYGFLRTWHVSHIELDRQIQVANQAVRLTLHSFKNRFLAVQMAMNLAQMTVARLDGTDCARQTAIQLQNVQDICLEALKQLDALQVQAGRLQLNPGEYTWAELWEEAVRRCGPRLASVRLETRSLNEVRIWGDPEHLATMLENLLQNAIDATENRSDGLPATITATMGREYEWGFIRIADNGPGIPKKILRKIFRPFFTTKPSKNNWGMGLAYCHRVVKGHHGYINIHSRPGSGTTVEVVIRSR